MTNTSTLTLTGVAYRCQQETARFWQQLVYDPTYCFELFHRALSQPSLEHSKQAWTYIHQQYHRQVMLWVKRHQLFTQTGLEPDVLANLALEKMWLSFASDTDKLAKFPLSDPDRCLKSLLRFLQMCVHSVVVDTFAAAARAQETVDVAAATALATAHTDPVMAEEFWHQIAASSQ
ncbi:MAG: hypothetical protein R2911_26270 [Caldilineaceae bacterium]